MKQLQFSNLQKLFQSICQDGSIIKPVCWRWNQDSRNVLKAGFSGFILCYGGGKELGYQETCE